MISARRAQLGPREKCAGHLGRYYFEKAAQRMWYVTAYRGSALRWPFSCYDSQSSKRVVVAVVPG